MVEEQHLFKRAGFDLAVFGQAHRHLSETVGFARGVETEGIGFAFGPADQRILRRGHCQHPQAQTDREHRQRGRIAHLAHPPPFAEPADKHGSHPAGHEQAEREQAQHDANDPPDVVELVVPHLVPHHREDFVFPGPFEQIVIERDADRRAETGDIGRNALVLLRLVEHVNVLGGYVVPGGDCLDPIAQRTGLEFGIFVEQRRNEDRPQHHADQHEQADHARPPQPPAAWRAANDSVDRGYDERHEHQRHGEADRLFPRPGAEILIEQIVAFLAHVSGVDRPWQRHDRSDQRIGEGSDRGDDPCALAHPLCEPPDGARDAEAQQQPVDQNANQRTPEQQPVPSLEIRIRLGARRALERIEIGPRRRFDIEGPRGGNQQFQHVRPPWRTGCATGVALSIEARLRPDE